MKTEQTLQERIKYINSQLAAHGHLDGWVVQGFKAELDRLEKKVKKVKQTQ